MAAHTTFSPNQVSLRVLAEECYQTNKPIQKFTTYEGYCIQWWQFTTE